MRRITPTPISSDSGCCLFFFFVLFSFLFIYWTQGSLVEELLDFSGAWHVIDRVLTKYGILHEEKKSLGPKIGRFGVEPEHTYTYTFHEVGFTLLCFENKSVVIFIYLFFVCVMC